MSYAWDYLFHHSRSVMAEGPTQQHDVGRDFLSVKNSPVFPSWAGRTTAESSRHTHTLALYLVAEKLEPPFKR